MHYRYMTDILQFMYINSGIDRQLLCNGCYDQ